MRRFLAPARAYALTLVVGIGVLIVVLVAMYLASLPSCGSAPSPSSLSGGGEVCFTFVGPFWPFYLLLGSALVLIVIGAAGFLYHGTRRRKVPVAATNR